MQAAFVDKTNKTTTVGDTTNIAIDATSDTASDMITDNAIKIIEAADDYDLARNKTYKNLQDKLIERTDSLERMRYVLRNWYWFSVLTSTATGKPMLNWCWHLAQCKPLNLFLTGSRYENWLNSWRRSRSNLTTFWTNPLIFRSYGT